MQRISIAICGLAFLCSACAQQAQESAPAETTAPASAAADHPITGRTLSCSGDAAEVDLTFNSDGTISGRILRFTLNGNWTANTPDEVTARLELQGGPKVDTLRREGDAWVGAEYRCS